MAMLSRAFDCQIRPSNKEPEWSSLCNNVLDQYLDDTDQLFQFDVGGDLSRERTSSDDSGDVFNFSGCSEQSSNQTSNTSPLPSWEPFVVQSIEVTEAKQPRPKEPVDFWTKTLRALERNAAECEDRQQVLKTARSHPDFLSLGGCPSPPIVSYSPTDPPFATQRRKSRGAAVNGRKASQARSLSRGRPTGVTKSAATTVDPYATVRKCSASPSKMMNPSRYRAGFEDMWVDRPARIPKKYALSPPSQVLTISPPPPTHLPYHDLIAFDSPTAYEGFSAYDEQLSPLTSTFQHAHIHTPVASPPVNRFAYASNSHLGASSPILAVTSSHTIPLNDTAPLFPERSSSLAPNKIAAFDFGFSSSPDLDAWSAAPFDEPAPSQYSTDPCFTHHPFEIHTTEGDAGLGITCDPSLVTHYLTGPELVTLPATIYQPAPSPYYVHPSIAHNPVTPTHRRAGSRAGSRARSLSLSPTPATEPKSRRSSRRTSRHRRAKSTNLTPRHSQNLEKNGFVNFTPQDSSKLLNGVAPSGSSKTKARREKEAADKRRKLSQAAVRAIVEAGGDLEGFRRDGLLG